MLLSRYSAVVLEHFFHSRNVGSLDKQAADVGTGVAGTVTGGDVIRLQIRVNSQQIIREVKFKAQGTVAVIAACSWVTEWLPGKTLDAAWALQSAEISAALQLPAVKLASVLLVEDAVKAALKELQSKQERAGA